jgi:hypothetical protein
LDQEVQVHNQHNQEIQELMDLVITEELLTHLILQEQVIQEVEVVLVQLE